MRPALVELREVIVRLHRTGEDVPENGVRIDATAPLERVVDEIIRRSVGRVPAP